MPQRTFASGQDWDPVYTSSKGKSQAPKTARGIDQVIYAVVLLVFPVVFFSRQFSLTKQT